MKKTFLPNSLLEINTRLEQAHKAFQKRYPGSTGERQPVHTVYGGAPFSRGHGEKIG